jgi:peptidylprolyl isomerase
LVRVQSGDRVQVHLSARFADGSEFASSRRGGPLEFTAGGRDVIAGVSRAVLGMESGDTKIFPVRPQDGFGAREPELERRIAVSDLPVGARIGDRFDASAGDLEIAVWVSEIDSEFAVLDANHPLAGHTLIFELELVSFHS